MGWLKNIFNKKKKHFLQGDIVVCIDDRKWNNLNQKEDLVFGKSYRILHTVVCPDCGNVAYDIGIRFDDKLKFTKCNETHNMPGKGIHLANHNRFLKIEPRTVLSEKHH